MNRHVGGILYGREIWTASGLGVIWAIEATEFEASPSYADLNAHLEVVVQNAPGQRHLCLPSEAATITSP